MNTQLKQSRSRNRREKIIPAVFDLSLIVALIVGLIGSALKPAIAAAQGTEAGQVEVQTETPDGVDAIISWNKKALDEILFARQNPAQMYMYISPVQLAVYNATAAVQGGFQLYHSGLALHPGASVDAAVATASHAMLVHFFPGRKSFLDADYASYLANIPAGEAKAVGVSVGQQAADELIALRQNDGLEANIGFTMPTPAIGVWQLPVGVNPISPWISKLRPYTLNSPDQFRPSPPPDLDSDEWAAEYEETRLIGRKVGSQRTPEQTDIAYFWNDPAAFQYNRVFQQIALDTNRGLSAVQVARLFAMGNAVPADAVIGCFDAKYYYLFWRPIYAIRQGNNDGNPGTTGEENWEPLLGTPPHPEYPSAHSCLTSATVEVLTAFLGTQRINVNVTSNAPNVVQRERYYEYGHDLLQELINARVWGGIHYRESDVKGSTLGRKVAHWALKRYFLPTGSNANQADAFGLESLWLPFLNR